MKVLLIATVDPSGKSGHNIATKEIISALIRNDQVDLSLICPYPENNSYIDHVAANLNRVFYLSSKKQFSFWWNFKIQLQMINAIRLILKKEKPDLVITRIGNCLTLPFLISFYKLPYYVLVRGVGSREIKNLSSFPGLQYFWKLVLLLNCRVARQVLVAYEEVKEEVQRYRKPDQPEPVIFPNAVSAALFPLVNKLKARGKIDLALKDCDFVIGYAGSIKKRHGLKYLIVALDDLKSEINNVKAVIVGDGPELESLKNEVNAKGLGDSIIFTGFVEHEDVHLYMAASDILYGVLDPEEVENPIKCYEYLASARPVITSQKEEFEFIAKYGFGEVINSLDYTEITEAIKRLYYLDQSDRCHMGIKGREYVLKNHTWDKLIDYILSDYINST